MRRALSFMLIFMLLFSQTSWAAMPLCASVHVPTLKAEERVLILADSSAETSVLRLIRKDLSDDASGLADLIAMAGQTTAVRLDQKNFDKKSEITLGLLLKDGYSLEFHYEADARFDHDKFIVQNVEMVTPTNYRKDITKQILDRHKLEFYADGIHQLNDLYPPGFKVNAKIPILIEGSLLESFRDMLPRLGNFKKNEIRQLVEKGDLKKLRFMGHFRTFKDFVQKTLAKMSFKEAVRMGVLVLVMSHIQSSGTKEVVPPVTPTHQNPASQKWVREMNFHLQRTLSPEARQEAVLLEKEIQNQLGVQNPIGGLDPNQPKIQVGLSDFVWLVEKAETKKTFIAFSRDAERGNLEYFMIEIDPAVYPKTIAALKQSKQQMNVE